MYSGDVTNYKPITKEELDKKFCGLNWDSIDEAWDDEIYCVLIVKKDNQLKGFAYNDDGFNEHLENFIGW